MILTSLLLSFSETSQLILNLFTGFIVFWVITYLIPTIKRIRSLPPGPWGIPFAGYLPFIGKTDQYKDIDRLAKKYGPVYSVRLGSYCVIVLSDWEHIKEAFENDALLDRPINVSNDSKAPSIIEMCGETWRAHRRLTFHMLRDVGLGKSVLEMKVKREIEKFIPTLDIGPIELYPALLSTVSNNISNFLMGHGLEYDDPINKKLTDILIILGKASSQFLIFTGSQPQLIKSNTSELDSKIHETLRSLADFATYLEKEIEVHKRRGKSTGSFEDFISGYLMEVQKRDKSKVSDDVTFSIEILRQNLIAFYEAGTETISATLAFAILYLLEYPEYFDKIRTEIGNVIGFEKQPDYSDRLNMPFTMSFINEVHRMASIVPLNLFRRATKDTNIGNFNVPKDALIILNLYAINRDKRLWINPNTFDPSRFLAEHGTKSVKPPFLVPFSGGRRACPGESLANVEIFLYLVNIVQNYRIKLSPGSSLSIASEYGSIRRPKNIPELIFEKI